MPTDEKTTQMTEITAPTGDDLVLLVNSPGGTPASGYSKEANLYLGMAIDGQDFLSNYTITTSRASNAETIAIKTKAGTDPSSTDPVRLAFRNSTSATGDYTIINVTAATSITINSTATMGATNNVLFRVYLVGVNDGGTFRLGVINLTPTGVYDLREDTLYSSTAIDAAADNVGVLYTGTAVTSKAIRILGYLEYTLATAGTWVTAPSKIQLAHSGMPFPQESLKVAKAWVRFTGTGTPTIGDSFNVTSITDNGTGDWTANYTNALPDANYCVNVSMGAVTSSDILTIGVNNTGGAATGSVRVIAVKSGVGVYDVGVIYISVFAP